jgi:hypothetical protein
VKIIYIYLQSFVASISLDRINGVMVSMLVSTGVDRGFKPQSGGENKLIIIEMMMRSALF